MALITGEMWDIEKNIPSGYRFTSGTMTPTGMSGNLTFSRSTGGVRVNPSGASELMGAGVPRFTHDPKLLTPQGILIEPSTTNSLAAPDDLTNAAWNAPSANAAITPNVTADSFGNMTMDRISSDGTNNRRKQTVAHTSGTITWYEQVKVAKKAAAHTLEMSVMLEGGTTPVTTTVQIVTSTGVATRTVGTGNFGVIEYTNHWLLWAAATDSNSGNNTRSMQLLIPTSGQSADVGEMQLEPAPMTSYVPGGGVRAGDVLTKPFTLSGAYSAVIEATTTVSVTPMPQAGSYRLMSVDDGTLSNRVSLHIATGNLVAVVTTGGVEQASVPLVTGIAGNTKFKVAFAIRANDFAVIVSGGTIQTDATVTLPVVSTLRIGTPPSGDGQWGGTISSFQEFPGVRLSNTELANLVA